MSHYANSDFAETRMRLGLKYNLKQVRDENGYRNTLAEVWDEIPSSGSFANYPAVVLIVGKEEVLNRDQSDQLWHIEVPIVLLCYIREGTDTPLARETLKADILHRLGNYWNLPDETGDPTCFQVKYTGSEPFGMVMNKPKAGVAIGIKVKYRQEITDPSVAG